MHFSVPTTNQLLTTRTQGDKIRRQLEDEFRRQRPRYLEIDFNQVKALTISFTDEFLGRFLTEIQATATDPIPVLVCGLSDDTGEELNAVLERRKLAAVGQIDGRLQLLGGDSYLRAIFDVALAAGDSTPAVLAEKLGITVQNANNRLKKLVTAGALERNRVSIAGGGREYSYRVPDAFRAPSAA